MPLIPSEQELRDLLKEGKTLYQISRQFNTTVKEVHKLEIEYGITRKNKIPRPNKQDLESMYNDEHLTQYQIGKEFDVQAHTVSDWLRKHNIPTRGSRGTIETVPPKEVLERMYTIDGMTQDQIAKEFGKTRSCVEVWISKHNIPTRGSRGTIETVPPKEVLERMYTIDGMTQDQIAKEFGKTRPTVQVWIRKHNIPTRGTNGTLAVSMPPKDDLLNYIAEGLNQHQIAEKYNVSDVTIFRWCEYYGIPGMVNSYRCMTDEHRNWRYAVFDRDHRTCQMCGETNTPMEAHHIVPHCDHPEVAYELENGITLCEGCHKSIRGREYEYLEQFAAITQRPQSVECI